MRTKCVQIVFVLFFIAAMSGTTARAQAAASSSAQTSAASSAQTAPQAPARKAPRSMAETDLSFSFYRAFTSSTSGNDTLQTPFDSNGGMVELRHIQSPLIGYEVTYADNIADQAYAPNPGACGFLCATPPIKLHATGSQVGLDWVISDKMGALSPFAVAGMGFFINMPSLDLGNINTAVRPMWIYGGGLDWGFSRRMGIRDQYRGNVYKAPDLDANFNATGKFTQSREPMIGVYFRL